jgi:hypothetical protein
MRTRTIVICLVLALVGLGTAWFLATHDRVSKEEWVGATGEARLRPFLAAELLAERMGVEVSEIGSMPELDALPAQAVLLLPRNRQELHAGKIAELLQWVERGGHLIAEAEYVGVQDPLFERLGIIRSKAEGVGKPLVVELPHTAQKLSVYFGDWMSLNAGTGEERLRVGSSLISFPRGQGLVTAATSLDFARNPGFAEHRAKQLKRPGRSIAAHDHAELFWQVLSLTPERELQVYFRPERLSLWGFLVEYALPALTSAALLLLLWLWHIAPRFGPVAPDAPPGRRRLLDHLRASGRYYWAKGLRSRLVVAARDAALRRLARAQPDFVSVSQTEKAARLASIANISRQDAARFMSAAGAMRGADFIRVTQHAQRVHSALEKGTRK